MSSKLTRNRQDPWQGAYPRWHISFNITMLRLVSFNMDYHWACHTTTQSEVCFTHSISSSSHLYTGRPKHVLQRPPPTPPTESLHLPHLPLLHPLPTPLHRRAHHFLQRFPMAGLSPSPFTSETTHSPQTQHRRPITNLSTPALTYSIRFLANLLVMELILHFMYVVAIKDTRAWIGASPAQIAMVGFWNLIIVWLKVTIPPLSSSKKTFSLTLEQNKIAPHPMALLPPLGTHGRHRPSRKHGPLHG